MTRQALVAVDQSSTEASYPCRDLCIELTPSQMDSPTWSPVCIHTRAFQKVGIHIVVQGTFVTTPCSDLMARDSRTKTSVFWSGTAGREASKSSRRRWSTAPRPPPMAPPSTQPGLTSPTNSASRGMPQGRLYGHTIGLGKLKASLRIVSNADLSHYLLSPLQKQVHE